MTTKEKRAFIRTALRLKHGQGIHVRFVTSKQFGGDVRYRFGGGEEWRYFVTTYKGQSPEDEAIRFIGQLLSR